MSLPYFNNLLGVSLRLNLFAFWYTIPLLILFSLIVSFLAGSYPSLFLSSFNPYEVLKGSVRSSTINGRLRRVLVVFQFAVSILLIVGTLIMYRQIKFMLNKDVGFNKEQLLIIERADALDTRLKSFKESVKGMPGVINIASSTAVPGHSNNVNGYMMEGRKDESFLMTTTWIDYNFLETYGMTLVSGRPFNESFTTDQQACILNESAVKNFKITDPDKTRILQPGPSGNVLYAVIGVVKNFHQNHCVIRYSPYLFSLKSDNDMWGYLTVKLSVQNYSRDHNGYTKVLERIYRKQSSPVFLCG